MLGELKPCNLLFIMADQHRYDFLGRDAGQQCVLPKEQ